MNCSPLRIPIPNTLPYHAAAVRERATGGGRLAQAGVAVMIPMPVSHSGIGS
jgi:hypothetical protein